MGKPTYLKVEKTILHPPEVVWQIVALGFGEVSMYNPEIKHSKLDSKLTSGVGTRRHCEFAKKGFIKEQIIEWNDGHSFKLSMIHSSVPMEFLESKYSFEQKESNTHVTQEFWFRLKSPMGWASALLKGKMRSTLKNGLDGLEFFLNK